MFGIFQHDSQRQCMVWLTNVETRELANDAIARGEFELEADDALMVIELSAFKMEM